VFTGIVELKGEVVSVLDRPGGRELTVAPCPGEPDAALFGPVAAGESISVSGVCLTARGVSGSELTFDVVPESLSRTTLGRLRRGDHANLERSLQVGGRLGGHFVTGHIDGLGEVLLRKREGDQVLFQIGAVRPLLDLTLPKGSVAVDGISLTVIEVDRAGGWFSFAAIPHTLSVTTLGERKPGDPVNLECDLLGKWVIHGLKEVVGQPPRETILPGTQP
jgi:riboflavin synthase